MEVLGAPMRSDEEIDAGEVFSAAMSSSELQETKDQTAIPMFMHLFRSLGAETKSFSSLRECSTNPHWSH